MGICAAGLSEPLIPHLSLIYCVDTVTIQRASKANANMYFMSIGQKLWYKCDLATWRNVPLSTQVKIASRQGKKPLTSRLVLQICCAEMIKRS